MPSATVVACWIFGGYEPFPGLDNCWIHAGIDRFIYFHTFTILGLGVSAVLGPITVRSLWRAYCDASDQSDYARIFRVMLIRQVLLAFYGSIMFFAFLLGGANTLYLKINPEAHKTWYVKQTAYTYCMLSAVNFSTLGIFVSIIFFSTKTKGRATRRLCSRVCLDKARACNSTRNVYTSTLLEYAREQLLNESLVYESSNSSNCGSFSSHGSGKRRGSLDEWVSETEDATSFSSSSPRAAATPYLLHDDVNARSEFLSTRSHFTDACHDQESKSCTTEF